MANFRQPKLSEKELYDGTRLGIDTWADTCCAGKHAYVEEFLEGQTVTAQGFTSTLGTLKNLPIADVLYAYDCEDGRTIIIECNNSIYMGTDMEDSLMNPIQAEENDVRIDVRPKAYYPEVSTAQTVTFNDGTIIDVKYDGVLPYIPIRCPTKIEIDECERVTLTQKTPWDPFQLSNSFSRLHTDVDHHVPFYLEDDPISTFLNSDMISPIVDSNVSMVQTGDADDDDSDSSYVHISAIGSRREDSISPSELSDILGIGLATASRTLKATTHQCIRSTGLLAKRFKTDKSQLRYKQLSRHSGPFYCDFLKAGVKSIRNYMGGVLYTHKCGFKKFYPCENETQNETGRSLRGLVEMVGLPPSLHSDNHRNFKEGLFKRLLRKFGIYATYTEPHSPWQNRAEPAIGEVKSYARRLMQKTDAPIRLWCFCYEYSADVLSLLASGRFELQGRTPYEFIMNYTPDISEYVSYRWFQWCWYYDERTKTKSLCRWLGPAHHVGQSMCSYILLDNAHYIARSSVIGIPPEELYSDEMKERTARFMKSVEEKIGNYKQAVFDEENPNYIYFDAFGDDRDADAPVLPYGDEIVDAKTEEIDSAYLESLDEYIGAEVVIPGKDGVPVLTKVKSRKRDSNGNPVGISNPNPILDSRIYELEFPDGRIEEYAVNVIAENLFNQADDDGWDCGLLDEIIDIRKDDKVAVSRDDGYVTIDGKPVDIQDGHITSSNGNIIPVITTKGWDVQVRWKDGSTNWIPMSDLKEGNPVELAEYVVSKGLQKEPAFNWWVKSTLRQRDRLVSKLKSNVVRKGRMKFGIDIPGTVKQALDLDEKNGNTLWQDAIEKEMKNSRIAFKLLERGAKAPVGHKEITCHLIFDLKLDMTRKARYVAGGHLTDVPTHMTYSSVVSRDTVRIGFLVAALNNLEIEACDIQNAFLQAPTKEKIFFYAGDEWKADKDRIVVVVRALYGLKSSALQFRNHLADTLSNKLGFISSLADPDLWYKPAVDKDGFKYYSYILVYVDDLCILDKAPHSYMLQIQESFKVREETIKEPDAYLGADVRKVYYPDGSYAWTMGSKSYVKKAVNNLKKKIQADGYEFNKKLSDRNISAPQPFSSVSYRAELDTSVPCTDAQVTLYQNMIGIMRWIVELGRIDIAYEVSVLSRYLVEPRTGHFLQALHMFKHLEIHMDNELAFDPAMHNVEDPAVTQHRINTMKEFYPDAKEELPPNAPEPRGNPVQVNCFVDSDHAGDRITRRSQTGILLYCNSAPIVWYSKRQSTVESSTFGSEFVALRVATELIISLRYKLRMFGIPVEGPANVFCDNEAVYKNVSHSESTLKKKHNSICYHRVRECVAAGILVVHKVDSEYNLADILTKALPAPKRLALRERICFCDTDYVSTVGQSNKSS